MEESVQLNGNSSLRREAEASKRLTMAEPIKPAPKIATVSGRPDEGLAVSNKTMIVCTFRPRERAICPWSCQQQKRSVCPGLEGQAPT